MQKLAADRGIVLDLDSAGTAAYHVGHPSDARSQAAALKRGVDMSEIRARQVTVSDFYSFDKIFAMDRQNYNDLAKLMPQDATATLQLFLEEFGRMGEAEVPDPYYGGESGFEYVLDLLQDAGSHFLDREWVKPL